jgi:membrane-associated phospholipid phosphatase
MLLILCLPMIGFCLVKLMQHYYAFNTPLFMFINGSSVGPEWLWQDITFLGDGLPAYVIMIFLCRNNARLLWVGLISALLVGLVIQIGKPLFDLVRPAAMLGENQIHIIGQTLRVHSFPSGHSATAFIMAGILTQVLPKNLKWLLIIGAALIAWSRVKVGAHWPSDVVLGSMIGWQLARLALCIANRTPTIGHTPRSQLWLYGFASACAIALWTHNGGYPLAAPLARTLSLFGLGHLVLIAYQRDFLHNIKLQVFLAAFKSNRQNTPKKS